MAGKYAAIFRMTDIEFDISLIIWLTGVVVVLMYAH
jgi:hypothetical protein